MSQRSVNSSKTNWKFTNLSDKGPRFEKICPVCKEDLAVCTCDEEEEEIKRLGDSEGISVRERTKVSEQT